MKSGDFLSGMLVGVVIGAVAGLLLAPQSGEETREDIKEFSIDVAKRTQEGARHLIESGKDMLEQGREKAAQVAGTVRSRLLHNEQGTEAGA
jgi:gas vesicle protein